MSTRGDGGGHRHLLLHLPYFQTEVNHRLLPHRQINPLPELLLETLRLGREFILSHLAATALGNVRDHPWSPSAPSPSPRSLLSP